MYIRVLAAVALLGSLPGLWQASGSLFNIVGAQSNVGGALSVVVLLMTITLPLFYAALARSDRPIHFPRRLRKLSIAAIVSFAGFILIGTGQYFKDILGYSPWIQKIFGPYLVTQNPLPILPFLVSGCANVAQLLLLIAFYRATDDEQSPPATRFMSFAAKAAAVSFGLWTAINMARLVAVPYTYAQFQDWAWRSGRPFTVTHLLGGVLPALLGSFAFFVLPFMVWRAIAARTKLAEQEAQRL